MISIKRIREVRTRFIKGVAPSKGECGLRARLRRLMFAP